MAENVPASVELAYQQLSAALAQVGGKDLDLLTAPWSQIEPVIARALGGAFDLSRPEHQGVALGVAAVLGKRLAKDDGAFWAANRESPDGLIMGFPDAIIMLSPFGAAMEALSRARLVQLDDMQKEIRTALGRARLSLSGGAAMRLGPADYERLFDPAFVQFVALDQQRLKEAWEGPAGTFARNLRDGIERAGSQLSPEVRKQLEGQLVGALSALDPQKSMVEQLGAAGRLVELAGHLGGTIEATRPAPEDFWGAVVLPLLFIGQPAGFADFDEEEKQAIGQGVDPLFLYLDVVPYQHSVEDEGLLGAFGQDEIGLPHPAMGGLSPLRLLAVKLDRLAPALAAFSAEGSKAAFQKFCEHVKAQTGTAVNAAQSEAVLNEAVALVGELKKIADARDKGFAALRRITEAEAAGEAAFAAIRKAMHGPRIILA